MVNKSKKTTSLYRVTVVTEVVDVHEIKSLKQVVHTRFHKTTTVEVTSTNVTMNHNSGALSFWNRTDGNGCDRVRVFPKSTWVSYEKIRDL